MESNGRAVFFGKAIIVFSWLLFFSATAVVTSEYVIGKVRSAKAEERKRNDGKPRMTSLRDAYEGFTVQHLHPVYLFFFPFDPADRARLGNDVVSVGPRGFRGEPSEIPDGRETAVLLGGSTGFGQYASSNETTITGYLNSMQDRYRFLNAAVPSWNSTQELIRLAYQIVELDPALVIAFDGANDATILSKYWEEGIAYPPGTPESFQTLSDLVDTIRLENPKYGAIPPWYERRLPELTRIARKKFGADEDESEPREPLPEAMMRETAAKYVLNLQLMQQLARANGAEFIGILQPIRSLHRNVADRYKNPNRVEYFRAFHRDVLNETARTDGSLEFRDFSTIFDADFDPVPVYDKDGDEDMNDEMIFADSVHLFDRGNEIVARRIWTLVGEIEDRSAPSRVAQATSASAVPRERSR